MSTPAATPTKIQLAPNPAIANFRALQPQPKRAFDANFNSDTETYEGDVAFLLELELKKDAPAGAAELAFSARYQTCNPKMCVPSKWSGAATLTVDPATAPCRSRHPRRVLRTASARAVARILTGVHCGRTGRRAPRVPRRSLRLRPRLHLHALRLPDDPDHDVLLPQPAIRRAAREHRAGAGLLPGDHRALLRPRPGHHRHPGAVRHRHPGVQPVGQRVHLGPLHRLRAEPAGGLRDHHSLGDPHAPQSSRRTRAASSAACSWG